MKILKGSWLIFSLLFLMIVPDLFSQSWDIIKADTTYNYDKNRSGFIEVGIQVDSLYKGPVGTVYFLNTIVEDIDTSHYYVSHRSAQFLQRTVTKMDSLYIFDGPEHFSIRHKGALNETWEFDSAHHIMARISDLYSVDEPGRSDSIKIVTLSTGDTILLSKWKGIVRFDPVYGDERYDQVELPLPGFRDFFDLSVGDIPG